MRKTKHSSKNCNLLIIILQQVIKPFLVWNISIFSYQWSIAPFTITLLRVTVYCYHVTHPFQSEYTLSSFITSCWKQVQYLEFKWTVTLCKHSLSKHSAKKFSLLCSRLLDSFNENVLRTRDRQTEILASANFFLLVSKY